MANTLKFGNGEWYGKKDTILAYNDENNNYKPLPFDFSRASSATRVNKDGLIETVGSGEPRIDFKDNTKGSLLLEPTRSNLVTYSEDIESWSISGLITKENNVATSPDGTLNAGTIITNDASGFHRITQSISVSSNSTYTSSLFIKKVQSQTNFMGIGFIFTGGTTDVGYVIFDAVNGIAVSADARIDVISEVKDFGNYWKLQSTATDNGGNTSLQFNIYATLSTNGTTTGLGISSKRTIWGIQLEQGSYATSYIPTSGSAVTRVADVCNNSGNDQVINSTEGVLYAEIQNLTSLVSLNNWLTISDGTTSNFVALVFETTENIIGRITVGGVTQAIFSITGNYSLNQKLAFKWKENDFAFWINGVEVGTDSVGSVPNANTLDKLQFNYPPGGNNVYGKVKDIRVYNEALTDAQLKALTT
jgi:hypothetical protein